MLTVVKWGIFASQNKDQHCRWDMFWARFLGRIYLLLISWRPLTGHGTWRKIAFKSVMAKTCWQNIICRLWKSSKLVFLAVQLKDWTFKIHFQKRFNVYMYVLPICLSLSELVLISTFCKFIYSNVEYFVAVLVSKSYKQFC